MHHNMIPAEGSTPEMRRSLRTNQDLLTLSTAIYAAIRRRSRAVQRPVVKLVRELPDGTEEDLPVGHPAWRLFKKVTPTLTYRSAVSYIEQHKLTDGFAIWLKRRDAFGTVREFDIWNPRNVEVVPNKDRPTEPKEFKHYNQDGSHDKVQVEDAVYFRNLLDPRNPLYALGPIKAARVSVDTGLEALRYNRAFFDNDASPRRLVKVTEGGPAEVERITQQLERQHRGSDKAHRTLVIEGDVELLDTNVTHEDMQFVQQMQWTVTEVARAFEMSPILLGDQSQATKENLMGFLTDFWSVIQDQTEAVLADFTEFLLKPDFGADIRAVAVYDNIPFLQEDAERQARIDEIELKTGKRYINELRERDREESVPWGDRPLLPFNVGPLPGPAAGEEAKEESDGEQASLTNDISAGPPGPGPAVPLTDEEQIKLEDDIEDARTEEQILKAAEVRRRRGELAKTVKRILGRELKKLLAVVSAHDDLAASAHGSLQRPFPNEHACRLREPKDFREGTFRRQKREHDGKVYYAILGKLKGESTLTQQSYRYPKDTWTVAQARAHCKSHKGILFEPATSKQASARVPPPDVTDGYDWDWTEHEEQILASLERAYFAALMAAEYPEGDLAPAHASAVNYAAARGGELLRLDGSASLVAVTRARVAELTAKVIEEGGTVRDLKNALRSDLAFSEARALAVARTETAFAQGRASLESYKQLGHQGKEWRAAGANPCPICTENDGEVVGVDDAFPSGDDTVPAHPNCECGILPVHELSGGEEKAPAGPGSDLEEVTEV